MDNTAIHTAALIVPIMKRLCSAGIIRVDGYNGDVQCSASEFRGLFPEYEVTERHCDKYPYELSAMADGVRFYAVSEEP